MRLFKNFEPGIDRVDQTHRRSRNSPAKINKNARAPKESISSSEIRSKVEEHFKPKPPKEKVEVSELAKAKNEKAEKVEEVEAEKEIRPPSDVGLNNPKDPATIGKLKDVLTKGGFNFNPKERETLEKILGDSA
tara:strand:- start:726 stop:1127 length:402 start_codon:yes stop_codon:yes gene_type:complete